LHGLWTDGGGGRIPGKITGCLNPGARRQHHNENMRYFVLLLVALLFLALGTLEVVASRAVPLP
jgi:hypothetical protein